MRVVLCVLIGLACFSSRATADIIGLSLPVDSQNGVSITQVENVWSVSAPPFPLNTSLGIGYLINPSSPALGTPMSQANPFFSFVLHTAGYTGLPKS